MTDLLLANAIVAAAAFVQAASGIGFAMVAVPLLASIDLGDVPDVSLFAMLGLSLMMAWRRWRDIDGEDLPGLLSGSLVGTAIGAGHRIWDRLARRIMLSLTASNALLLITTSR